MHFLMKSKTNLEFTTSRISHLCSFAFFLIYQSSFKCFHILFNTSPRPVQVKRAVTWLVITPSLINTFSSKMQCLPGQAGVTWFWSSRYPKEHESGFFTASQTKQNMFSQKSRTAGCHINTSFNHLVSEVLIHVKKNADVLWRSYDTMKIPSK